jgi:tetratricopeptide (TPR) repeat protein
MVEVPEFAETTVFRGQLEVNMVQQTGGGAARALLNQAYARFPTSAVVTYLSGNFQQAVGDCAQALRFYDETLARHPVHELALLGRTVCLTYLSRQDDAIATATRMIELRTFNMSEAYFWRAWVYHDRTQLPQAREDIEHAKAMSSANTGLGILRLAGIIEHDQDDLDIAERDLDGAKNTPGGQSDCVARWYLALVNVKRQRWTDSAGHFEDAMRCYDNNAMLGELALEKMQANTQIDPEFKARQIEGFQAAIKEDRSQYYASAFNAANQFARGGDVPKARPLLEIASKDPALEKVVAELRKVIGGG